MTTRTKCTTLTHQCNWITTCKTGSNRLRICRTAMHINTMSCSICTEEVRISTTVSIAISVLICHLRSFNRIRTTTKSVNHHGCYSRTTTRVLHGRVLCIPFRIRLIIDYVTTPKPSITRFIDIHGRINDGCIIAAIELVIGFDNIVHDLIRCISTSTTSISFALNLLCRNHLIVYIRAYDIIALLLVPVISDCILNTVRRLLIRFVTTVTAF